MMLIARNLYTQGQYNGKDTFPWVSLCGIERNFLRCDDTPLVYTELDPAEKSLRVGQSSISHPFQPSSLSMTSTGRVYHKSSIGGKALVSDKLTDKLYHRFQFDDNGNPVGFKSGENVIPLLNQIQS